VHLFYRRHLEKEIDQLLKHEITAFLNYEPYARDAHFSLRKLSY